jgi:putative transposase
MELKRQSRTTFAIPGQALRSIASVQDGLSAASPIEPPGPIAMTNYRRNFLSGGCYFFTVNLADQRLRLLTDNIGLLRAAFRQARSRHRFTVEAAVILPNHLHAIWTLLKGDADFALRWRLIKSAFSRGLPAGERVSASRAAKGERGIWQRRYWEHTLRDDNDFARLLDYIHSTRSSTGMSREFGTGPIPHFAAGFVSAVIPSIGVTSPMIKSRSLASDDGFRCRSTHPTCYMLHPTTCYVLRRSSPS